MSVLALLNPTSLLGNDIREALEQRRELWTELRLVTTRKDEVGRLTDVRGAATIVAAFDQDSLTGVDLAFLPGSMADLAEPLAAAAPGTTSILLAGDADVERGTPVIAGVNLEAAQRGETLVSPHPAAIAVAHLVKPLVALAQKLSVSATVILPASLFEQEGLDELFEQTRQILTFSSEKARKVFDEQLAFNLLPVSAGSSRHLPELVENTLGSKVDTSIQLLQGAVFHSLGISLQLRFEGSDPGLEPIRLALEESPYLEFVDDPDQLGPAAAAGREEILVGHLQTGRPGEYWLWAVMDNLTLGGALNAVRVAEAVL
ncbi:MAG: hypothetical protein K0U98_06780 [Deltaproteobacteria bacterium]|nr:hypothetical protein [Deltaproteobacteria bacterium]